MSVTAAILLTLSAFTHAGWNFISKKTYPTLAFYLVANIIGALILLPILPLYWEKLQLIPGSVWHFINISGFFLAAYMAALAGAYRRGDISIAYPIARSLPIIFVTCATMIFGLGQSVGNWFLMGALFILCGCVMLPVPDWHNVKIGSFLNFCCLLAVIAAICIAGYTIVDDLALRQLRNLPGTPFSAIDATLIYMVLEAISATIWKGIFVWFSAGERQSIKEVLSNHKGSAAITGIGIYLTYGLVLASMNYVTNVSYVAAFRQLSIPIGAILGMIFLREPRYASKILGLILIFSGLLLVATM
jgi:drug/metabolite transporter (DMT)-like permease